MTEIPIPKGTMLLINLRACNTWKELWGEDAEEWKPERWLEPLPKAVENAHIPGIYANLCVIWVDDLPEVRTSTELGLRRATFISGGYSCMCVRVHISSTLAN